MDDAAANAAAATETELVEAKMPSSAECDGNESAMQAKLQGSAPPLSSQSLSSVK